MSETTSSRLVEPLLHEARSFVEFLGEVGGRDKDEFLGNAYAMLFPIDWPEPFGLVMIESLACGTPVVAWRNGSVPEVIEDGVTGFVVDSVDDAVEAVKRVAWLDRPMCRKAFEQRFDSARMAREYVHVYRRLVQSGADPGYAAPRGVRFGAGLQHDRFVGARPALAGAVTRNGQHDL